MNNNPHLSYLWMDSPVGQLKLVTNGQALCAILWETDKPNRVLLQSMQQVEQHPILDLAQQQLTEYFKGQRQQFDIPLTAEGTVFQQRVWAALKTIPYGETRSYLDIAKQIDNPKAVRAVGAANGKNPISIIVPCHRVIGKNGSLTGFGGGLSNKEILLKLEQQVLRQSFQLD